MKEFRFRIFVILGAIALCLYLLYPTYADYQNTKKINNEIESIKETTLSSNPDMSDADIESFLEFKRDSIFNSDQSFREAREKRVKLGLDLQGGMYIVMEVNTSKLLEKLSKEPDDAVFKEVLAEAESESKITDANLVSTLATKFQERNIRLSRYFGSIREDDTDIISSLEEQEEDAVTRAIEIIRNRVDQYGVSEPSIQKQGSRRIIVELPGIAKEEEAKRLLQGSALLEFKLVKEADFAFPIMTSINKTLSKSLYADTLDTADSTSLAADSNEVLDPESEEFKKQNPFFSIARLLDGQGRTADAVVKDADRPKLLNYLARHEIKNIIPNDVEFVFGAKPFATQDEEDYYLLYLVNKTSELTGGVIVDAQANIDPQTTEPIVNMQMNSDGAREWARITGSNVGKRCAIILDNYVYSAPVINEKIPSGSSRISGMEDLNEAKLLEIVLKAGALPAPVDIIEERTVGPSLGQDSINQGFNSTMIGFLLVAVFMIIYYKKSGTIADLALFFTIIFIMGILAAFQATLTLPGIAGIILTIGMAVDANVLIYERIREELSTGKTVRAAIDSGYANSYSAIFDSNITTFFTGIILYQFGSGPIQGFALTLMIGILSSLFSALVVTRLVFDIMAVKGAKIQVG